MTTTTEPTPADTSTTGDTDVVDTVLLHRARTTADVLTGLITAGTLRRAGQPEQLPTLLWPEVDPQVVTEIWNAAAAVGFYAGTVVASPRWKPEQLDRARTALADAGYLAMGHAVEAAAYAAPSRTPAPAPPDDATGARPHPTDAPSRRHP